MFPLVNNGQNWCQKLCTFFSPLLILQGECESALVPLPQLRTMFSSKVICFIFLVVFFNIWGQARGYERKRSLADAVKKFYLVKTKGAKSTDKHLETSAEDNWKNSPAKEVPNYQTDEDWKSQDHEYKEPKPKSRRKGSQRSTKRETINVTEFLT